MNWQVQIQGLSNSIQEAPENVTIVPYPRHPPTGGPLHGIRLTVLRWQASNRDGELSQTTSPGLDTVDETV